MINSRFFRCLYPALVILAFLAFLSACRGRELVRPDSAPATVRTPARTQPETQTAFQVHREIGFKSRRHLEDHYQKHGAEFDGLTRDQYLAAAQDLRDAPAGGNILEARRPDGTVSRFDRNSGAFLAFDSDLTIRTFFKPNDGERYFRRQINREH